MQRNALTKSPPASAARARRETPDLYPAFLSLAGRDVLVIGGGPVAARKVAGLRRAGARVTVVSPTVCPRLESLIRSGAVHAVCRRPYQKGDLAAAPPAPAWLVIAATGDPAANRAIFEDAERAHVFANVVDEPLLSSFHVPSVVRRGLLQVAVSTGGASPSLARSLRRRLQKQFGPPFAELLDALMDLRRHVRRKYPSDAVRRRCLLRSFVDSPAPALLVKRSDPKGFYSELEKWKSL